uniref:Uncharacterized protein n=1 Tax=Anguilla anguilla TaxID=7936 RepID=A0A0E9XEA7_ANGAN
MTWWHLDSDHYGKNKCKTTKILKNYIPYVNPQIDKKLDCTSKQDALLFATRRWRKSQNQQ